MSNTGLGTYIFLPGLFWKRRHMQAGNLWRGSPELLRLPVYTLILRKVRKVEKLWARMFRGALAKEKVLELGVTVTLQFTEHFMTGFPIENLDIPLYLFLEMPLALNIFFSKSRSNYQNTEMESHSLETIPYPSHSCNYLLLSSEHLFCLMLPHYL